MALDEKPAKLEQCHRCRRAVIECVAQGWWTRADPTAVDLDGQLAARRAGLRLYRAWPQGARLFLTQWGAREIRLCSTQPAILAQHECDFPVTSYWDREGQQRIDRILYPVLHRPDQGPPPF